MSNPSTNLQQVFNMTLSGKGPKVVPQFVDLLTASSAEIDLSPLIQNGNMDFISGFFFDNTASAVDLIVRTDGVNQKLLLPAGTQGYLPSLSPNNPKFIITAASSPGLIIPFFFYNIPLLPYIWPNASGGGGGGEVDITAINGVAPTDEWLTDTQLRATPIPVSVTSTAPTLVDYSLALSGASETLVAAGDAENYFIVYNPIGNADISVNLAGGDASISGIPLPAGSSIELQGGVASAVTIDGTAAETVNCFAG